MRQHVFSPDDDARILASPYDRGGVGNCRPALAETLTALAREFGVNKATLSKRRARLRRLERKAVPPALPLRAPEWMQPLNRAQLMAGRA